MSFFRSPQQIVLAPNEGLHLNVLGELITLLITGDQTAGAFSVLTETSPPGSGTPLHTHRSEDEALFILDGEYEITCGSEIVRAGPRSFVFAPRQVPHRLKNVSAGTSKLLGIVSPAGFEGFWQEISQLREGSAMEEILAIAAKYRLEILG